MGRVPTSVTSRGRSLTQPPVAPRPHTPALNGLVATWSLSSFATSGSILTAKVTGPSSESPASPVPARTAVARLLSGGAAPASPSLRGGAGRLSLPPWRLPERQFCGPSHVFSFVSEPVDEPEQKGQSSLSQGSGGTEV